VDMHSGGSKAVSDPKNILSRNAAVRTPSCRNVTVIGNGQFDGYMGIEQCKLIHVVSFLNALTLIMPLTRPRIIQNSTKRH